MVPHVRQRRHPRPRLVVERLGDERVGLEEGARPQPQRHAGGQPHREGRAVGQHDLPLALEHRLVLRLHVDRHHPQVRQRVLQVGQARADPRLQRRRAHDQAQQQLAVGRLGQQDVLELAAAGRDVVRRQAGRADPVGDATQGRRDRGGVQAAVTQVDAGEVAVEDAQGRGRDGAADRHLGLVAEARLRPGDRRQPQGRVDERPRVRLLVGELAGARDLEQAARAAAEGVVVVAVHPEGQRCRPIHSSTSADVRGRDAERFRLPSAVTRMSSSMRMPMPRSSSGTSRSSSWK